METTPSLSIQSVPISSLHLDPGNVRLHGDRNLEAIKASLVRFGQQKPIVVGGNGVIRAGNGTFEAAMALGWESIQVVVTDLQGSDATTYAIADNRTAELAEWDMPELSKLLIELRAEEALVSKPIPSSDIDDLLNNLEPDMPEVVEDIAPGPPDAAVSQAGDLWILGRHRLLCGDSSQEADLDRLLAGAPIHLVNMDPPYNVKVEPRSKNAIAAGLSSFAHSGKDSGSDPKLRAKDRPLENDFVTEDEFDRLLRAWFSNASRVLEPGRGFYIWGGYANLAN